MSFLKRLLGSKSQKPSTTPQPAAPTGRDARKAPRVPTGELENVRFETSIGGSTVSLPIQNLSTTGAGLVRGALTRWPQRGDTLEGELVFAQAEERVPLRLRIVHISPTNVGCTFDEPAPGVALLLERYFSVEISALRLRPVRADALKPVPEGTPVWLTGPGHSEIYYVRAPDGEIAKFDVMLFGNRLTGERGRAAKSGDGAFPEAMKPAFRKFIESLDSIPREDQSRLISALELTHEK